MTKSYAPPVLFQYKPLLYFQSSKENKQSNAEKNHQILEVKDLTDGLVRSSHFAEEKIEANPKVT